MEALHFSAGYQSLIKPSPSGAILPALTRSASFKVKTMEPSGAAGAAGSFRWENFS